MLMLMLEKIWGNIYLLLIVLLLCNFWILRVRIVIKMILSVFNILLICKIQKIKNKKPIISKIIINVFFHLTNSRFISIIKFRGLWVGLECFLSSLLGWEISQPKPTHHMWQVYKPTKNRLAWWDVHTCFVSYKNIKFQLTI